MKPSFPSFPSIDENKYFCQLPRILKNGISVRIFKRSSFCGASCHLVRRNQVGQVYEIKLIQPAAGKNFEILLTSNALEAISQHSSVIEIFWCCYISNYIFKFLLENEFDLNCYYVMGHKLDTITTIGPMLCTQVE